MNNKANKAFIIAFSVSLGVHVVLLAGDVLSLSRFKRLANRPPLEVVYDELVAKKILESLQDQLKRATAESVANASFPQKEVRTSIRIPDRQAMTEIDLTSDNALSLKHKIDLTDLVAASQGNPVLLSYFSAIRQRIQKSANRQAWVTTDVTEGLVYVTFELGSDGRIRDASVANQSIGSGSLKRVAVQIVRAASPFPPFPPSIIEPSKVIVVPLEFLLGS